MEPYRSEAPQILGENKISSYYNTPTLKNTITEVYHSDELLTTDEEKADGELLSTRNFRN